jgi:hypothetical protein
MGSTSKIFGLPQDFEYDHSPGLARWLLNAFHKEDLLQDRLLHEAFIHEEGLKAVQRDLIRKAIREERPWKAAIDLDATVVESQKQEAYFASHNLNNPDPECLVH